MKRMRIPLGSSIRLLTPQGAMVSLPEVSANQKMYLYSIQNLETLKAEALLPRGDPLRSRHHDLQSARVAHRERKEHRLNADTEGSMAFPTTKDTVSFN